MADGVNAYLSEPFAIKSLANQVLGLIKDPKKLALMQATSLENAKRFTIDKVGETWENYFNLLLENKV